MSALYTTIFHVLSVKPRVEVEGAPEYRVKGTLRTGSVEKGQELRCFDIDMKQAIFSIAAVDTKSKFITLDLTSRPDNQGDLSGGCYLYG